MALRPIELVTLKWENVNFEKQYLELYISKVGRDLVKPLSHQAIGILETAKKLSASDYAFPGDKTGLHIGKEALTKAIGQRIGGGRYKGRQTVHGVRAVFSTWAYECGDYDSLWVEQELSHNDSNKIRSAYNRALYVEQRRGMMQRGADAVDAARDKALAEKSGQSGVDADKG